MEIFKEFTFEAAHRLPNVPEGHKCGRLHGHSFKVRLTLEGQIDPGTGWIVDFADVKQAMSGLLQQLDHTYLNEVQGLENPTSEIIAEWIASKLSAGVEGLQSVTVWETCTCGATFRMRDK